MDIKSLSEMRIIKSYLSNMEFKKSFFGGYDRGDVEGQISRLVELYDDLLKKADQAFKEELQDKDQKLRTSMEEALQQANDKATEGLASEYEAEYQQRVFEIQEEYQAKSKNLKESVVLLEKAAKQMYVKAKEESASRIDQANAQADRIIERAEAEARRIAAEAQEKVSQHSDEARRSLENLRSHIDSENSQLAGLMGEYARLVEEIRGRDESMKERIDSFYGSMADIIEQNSRLDTGVGKHSSSATAASDSSMWTEWLSSIFDSIRDDDEDDATLIGHRRFVSSVADAQKRVASQDNEERILEKKQVKGAHAARETEFEFTLD